MTKHLAVALRAVAAATPDVLWTVAGLVAAALIAYGAWLIYEPAGYITGGVLILLGVIARSFAVTAGPKAD